MNRRFFELRSSRRLSDPIDSKNNTVFVYRNSRIRTRIGWVLKWNIINNGLNVKAEINLEQRSAVHFSNPIETGSKTLNSKKIQKCNISAPSSSVRSHCSTPLRIDPGSNEMTIKVNYRRFTSVSRNINVIENMDRRNIIG